MDTRKKLILIIVSGSLGLGIIITAVWLSLQPRDGGDAFLETAIPISRDQDTGELVTNDPRVQEPGETRVVLVLGLENLFDYGMFERQVVTVREKIEQFSVERLDGKYDTLTLRPQNVAITITTYATTIRLGDTNILLPITITATDEGLVRVVIDDPNNSVGGSFDSGETILFAD